MEYASRTVFLDVAGKNTRQEAQMSGYDCAPSICCETQYTTILAVPCYRISKWPDTHKAPHAVRWRR